MTRKEQVKILDDKIKANNAQYDLDRMNAEGLLKRLKNIEDKSNNQLLALKDINTPAIKGRNGNGNDIDDDDYKKIQDYKNK